MEINRRKYHTLVYLKVLNQINAGSRKPREVSTMGVVFKLSTNFFKTWLLTQMDR